MYGHHISSAQAFGVLPSIVKKHRVLHFLYLATVDSRQILLIPKDRFFEHTSVADYIKMTLAR